MPQRSPGFARNAGAATIFYVKLLRIVTVNLCRSPKLRYCFGNQLFKDEYVMAKPQASIKPVAAPVPGFAATVPAQLDSYVPGDAIPVPDVIEKDSESVWALWSDAVKYPPDKDKDKEADPHAATQLMGLDELPKDADA